MVSATSFSNPFFSIAGQKERLTRAGQAMWSAIPFVGGGGLVATTSIKPLNSLLEKASNNVLVTAGVVAAVANPVSLINVAKGAATAFTGASSTIVGAVKSKLPTLLPVAAGTGIIKQAMPQILPSSITTPQTFAPSAGIPNGGNGSPSPVPPPQSSGGLLTTLPTTGTPGQPSLSTADLQGLLNAAAAGLNPQNPGAQLAAGLLSTTGSKPKVKKKAKRKYKAKKTRRYKAKKTRKSKRRRR
jgi:hypothetical protein